MEYWKMQIKTILKDFTGITWKIGELKTNTNVSISVKSVFLKEDSLS